jgi:rSAM/selenodomain-associated transferase 1
MKFGLIIFVKNLRYGEVKTRLASRFGNDQAIQIYKRLLKHTCTITTGVKADKFLFYSEEIEIDNWPSEFSRQVQKGNDLGERMKNAFELLFNKGYQNVLIIGSDCLELSTIAIEHGFAELGQSDIVIGPAMDGGYYLLGLKTNSPFLFENIEWSTSQVLQQTLSICNEHNMHTSLLEVLNDIDEPEDWLNAAQEYEQ